MPTSRSIAAEIEHHVTQSFKGPDAYAHLFGGDDWLMGFHVMAIHMGLAEKVTGKRITEDRATFERARELAMKAFDYWFEPGREAGAAVARKEPDRHQPSRARGKPKGVSQPARNRRQSLWGVAQALGTEDRAGKRGRWKA